jgi:spore germination cell wall hydrolase CwlJ-like protein
LIKGLQELAHWRGRECGCVALLLLSASCVPSFAADAPKAPLRTLAPAPAPVTAPPATLADQSVAPPAPEPMQLSPVTPTDAAAINASIPLATGPNPRASSVAFRGAGAIDQMRSLQCLAEAVYYEARSESEDGQRAVAQVVLNRVRHPAYPSSVCGVVYQGPMRAGGGCQFTFTCDGSLSFAPGGPAWLRARRIASLALSGSVFAPVGLATHYHTQQVVPVWAFRLVKSAVIGSHSFYRMPGAWGGPGAYSSRYAGREPAPAAIIASRLPVNLGPARLPVPSAYEALAFATPAYPSQQAAPQQAAPQPAPNDHLPQSRVRPEFERSGRLLSDAVGNSTAQPIR